MVVSILLLVISLNLDSLGVGFIYGMQKLRISNLCKAIICLSSVVYSSISIFIGSSLKNHINAELGKYLVVCILVIIGLCTIFKACRQKTQSDIKNNLTLAEAFFLSFALSIDSIGAGIGFSLIGLNLFFIPFLIGLGQLLFLELGFFIGYKIVDSNKLINTKFIAILPGILLILLALTRL